MIEKPSRRRDLAGQRFGMLVALERLEKTGHYFRWKCLCDCGTETVRTQPALVTGGALSCGCRKKLPNASHFKITHGASPRGVITPEKRLYRIWSTMLQRTTNPKAHAYETYGGRGIKMLPEWEVSFEAFRDYIGVAPTPKHSIDRIEATLGYIPGNIRWATQTTQIRNRFNTIHVEINGETKPLAEFCDAYGISNKVAYMRIFTYGWAPIDAVSIPVGQKRK